MNLVVLGATGRTGRLVVEQALPAGHTVPALVRSPEKLTIRNSSLRVVAGSATDAADFERALRGADAVVSTLGGGGSVIADATGAIVEAARKTGVGRVVVLSSFFVERDRLGAVPRLLTGIAMGSVIKDKSAGELLLRQSDLDWTIVYASLLKDGPVSGSVEVLPEGAKRRCGWSGSVTVGAVCLVVSNILENPSILTGFPFGHYHYTDALGPKLFLVPLLIGPAYFANGYFAWVIGNVLVGEVRRGSSAFMTVAVPFIAAFVMPMMDLAFDPRSSTIQHQWLWEQAGGNFGLPLSNNL